MSDFPILFSDRLRLSKLSVDDLQDLVRLANNRSISERIINIQHPYTDLQASMRLGYVSKGFREGSRHCFGIYLKDSKSFIGEISLHSRNHDHKLSELGYWIGEPYWGQGYATEAIAAIVDYGLTKFTIDEIQASCDQGNIASHRVLEKNGFTLIRDTSRQKFYKISSS